MRLAHIAPTAVLKTEVFRDLDFHLCIASQVLRDKEYARYYRKAKGFVILDVPTREEKNPNAAYSMSRLRRAIEEVQPSEVVLPDLWNGSPEANVAIALECALELTELEPAHSTRGPISLMAVPRGLSWDEYRDCAIEMAKIPGVKTIGVHSGTYEKFRVNREVAVSDFSERFPSFNIHLLGVVNDLSDIQNYDIVKRVRSADTAKLVRFGLDFKYPMYKNIPSYPGRGPGYFEREVSELQLAYVSKNIRYWDAFVQGVRWAAPVSPE